MAKIRGVHVPANLRNHIINGVLDFWQEKVGTTTTVNTATTTTTYPADMIKVVSTGATVKNYSLVRVTDVPTLAQSGFQSTYSLKFTTLTAIGSYAAGDLIETFRYDMEGLDYEKLHSKQVTLGFWIKASVAGIYSVSFNNNAFDRCYVTTVTVNGANTWEFKTLTITLDTTGTWLFDTSVGLSIIIGGLGGSTYTTSSLNQWQAGTFIVASTATNFIGTINSTFQIAQLSLVEGPLGLGAKGFARRGDSLQAELAMCQRYYEKSYDVEVTPGTSGGTSSGGGGAHRGQHLGHSPVTSGANYLPVVRYAVTKRATPAVSIYSPVTGAVGNFRDYTGAADLGAAADLVGPISFTAGVATTFTANRQLGYFWVADARL